MSAMPWTVAARAGRPHPLAEPARARLRSHFDLDDGEPVLSMPWMHWITLRVGEAMLVLQATGVAWLLWTAARSVAQSVM
jgi:hypothetical protein